MDGVGTAEEIFTQIRELVAVLPSNHLEGGGQESCEDDLNRACENIAAFQQDAALMLSQISDDHLFIETKKDHARDMTTGFLKLNGMTVGAVANCICRFDQEGEKAENYEAALTVRGLKKAAEFVRFCDAFDCLLQIRKDFPLPCALKKVLPGPWRSLCPPLPPPRFRR